MTKRILAYTLIASSLMIASCAQKTSPNTETAFTPQVQTDVPAAKPEKDAKLESTAGKSVTNDSRKMRRTPNAHQVAPPYAPANDQAAAMEAPNRNLMELPAAQAPAEKVIPAVSPYEATPEVGNFFVNHFAWAMMAVGGISAAYLIVAWRRKKTE